MRTVKKPVPLSEIIDFVKPFAATCLGSTERVVRGVRPLDRCEPDGWLSFCKSHGEDSFSAIRNSAAEVVICHHQDYPEDLFSGVKSLIMVSNPRLIFMRVTSNFFVSSPKPSIHPSAIIDPEAKIGENVTIRANCVIGAADIGEGAVLHEGVIIRNQTIIGKRVTIFPGTVIGGDGYGYERNEAGELEKFPHIGGVVIENDVEIGSNTCIDRGSIGDTRIRSRARIDNLVHVAHNVDVGEDVAVIALSLLGGSVKIGKGAWIAPSAVIRNQIEIGENATIGLGAVVTKNVPAGSTVLGNPAKDHIEFKKMMGAVSLLMKREK